MKMFSYLKLNFVITKTNLLLQNAYIYVDCRSLFLAFNILTTTVIWISSAQSKKQFSIVEVVDCK